MRKISTLMLIFTILLLPMVVTPMPSLVLGQNQQASQNSPNLPFVNQEYANGSLTVQSSPLKVWYDWINISGTQVVNYVAYTDPDYPYPGPIFNLIGQHLELANGSEVFVASALDKFEVYRDLNGDGIPQGTIGSTGSELLYYMFINMSDNLHVTPIQKTALDGLPHYKWGFTYENVYAYFLQPSSNGGINTVAKLVFDHITLSYDFSLNQNTTNLKTSFDIGKVTSLDFLGSPDFSLTGLSLALLYPTSTYASQPYSTSVNGQPYNSTTSQNQTINAQDAQVAVNGAKAYEYDFGGSYTLNTGQTNLTQQSSIQTYDAKAEVIPVSSLPFSIYGPTVTGISFFRDELNLTTLFGGSWQDINADYSASSFVYRVCFPAWNGSQIIDDPVYIGYLSGSTTIPEFPILTILIPALIIVSLAAYVIVAKQRRRFT